MRRHVVATYETPDEFVVVCDFVPGDTLYEVVSAQGRLPVSGAVRIALEVCEAVEELHRRGIAHCDISPRNVLLAADGAHLIDLGIARPFGAEPSSETPNLGTHGFAAPEQYGFAPVDERTDVYAVASYMQDQWETTTASGTTGVDADPSAYSVIVGLRHRF